MSSLEDAPEWLYDTIVHPQEGLSAILEGTAPGIGDADAALDTLLDWIDALDDEHVVPLDEAAAAWVGRRWGSWQPVDGPEAVLIARAWERACDMAVQLPDANRLRSALRERAGERLWYLMPLSPSPSLDPLGRFLAAIGTRQTDASLAPVWWHIARLTEDVPVHHLRYALNGLRWLPVTEVADRGRFRCELADFLSVAADSLARLAREGRLAMERARRVFLQLGRRAIALYPNHAWWLPNIARVRGRGMTSEWFGELFPEADDGGDTRSSDARHRLPPRRDANEHEFMLRGQELRNRLEADVRGRPDALVHTLELAEALISEERSHAEQTGSVHPLVLTLCSLATPILRQRPALAVNWAREAVKWEPWNGYSWTTLTRAIRSGEEPDKALPIAFRAVERVPHHQANWHELGWVLRDLGCDDQAEEVFEAEIERFGQVEGLTSLAQLHLRRGRMQDAKTLFERVLALEEDNWRALVGLARSLRMSGSAQRAADLLKPYVGPGQSDAARALREEYLRATQPREDVGTDPVDPAEPGPLTADVPDTFVHQARLLRRAAVRRADMSLARAAKHLLEGAAEQPSVIAQRALIDIELGDLARADSRALGGLERAPADLTLQYVHCHVAVRAVERDRPVFSQNQMSAIMATLRPLSSLNASAGPLVQLEAARASIGMVDGAAVLAEQRRRLTRLAEWRPHEQGDERRWWESHVREVVFGSHSPQDPSSVSDGTVVEARSQVMLRSHFLDQLQEELVTRVTASV